MEKSFEIAESIASRSYFIKRNMVAAKGLTLRYITYRMLRSLLSLYNGLLNSPNRNRKPWLTPASIMILDRCLDPTWTGIEFGSGRSTRFFACRLKKLVSIEHNPEWYDIVSTQLQQEGVKNAECILIPGIPPEPKKVKAKRNKQEFDCDNIHYLPYYEKLNEVDDQSLDFILIDGRARVECSKRAIPKLKSKGIFVLDNSERERYKVVHEMLSEWPKVHTTTGLCDTTLWFKP